MNNEVSCLFCIAVAGIRHDPRWIGSLGDDVEALVYQQEDPKAPHHYPEQGNEAAAYIQYIIDYYDCLPNVSLAYLKTWNPKWFPPSALRFHVDERKGIIAMQLLIHCALPCLLKTA